MSLEALRAGLRLGQNVHFLNYAATAPLLAPGAEAMARVAREGTRPLGEHFTGWLAIVESARRRIAGAIGARVDEVTLTTSTSTALSLAAGAVRWRSGDRVLYPGDEFPSNRFVWDNLRDFGVRAEGVVPEPGVGFADQLAATRLDGVRLVALSAVSYRDGRRLDVEAVCRLCRERGILTVVDAIQAVGAVPVEARQWGCDFLACGGQKWLLGPVGSGFLYVARERLEELHVPTVGWASSRHAGDHETRSLEWCEGAARFEAGLPDVAALAGLEASLAVLGAAGWSAIFAEVARHRERLAEALSARGFETLHAGLPGAHAGIVTFAVPETRMEALSASLARRGVVVTRRAGSIRVAAHAATRDEDVDAFLEALDGRAAARAAPGTGRSPERRQAAAGKRRPRWSRAVVTGASRGLGAAIAGELAKRGCSLLLLARDPAALGELAAELRDLGVPAEAVALDLSDPAAVARWTAAEAAALAETDLLVNNAARADAALFLETDDRGQRAAFETNVFAPLALARAVLPGMLSRRNGSILNVATAGARNALPLFSSYAASKAALWAWSEALGRELEGTGVTVTTFVPPHMDTATRRQLGRRAIAFYRFTAAAETEGHRPGQADRLRGVARRALAAAATGRAVSLPRRVRWEVTLNAAAPALASAAVRKLWRGSAPG